MGGQTCSSEEKEAVDTVKLSEKEQEKAALREAELREEQERVLAEQKKKKAEEDRKAAEEEVARRREKELHEVLQRQEEEQKRVAEEQEKERLRAEEEEKKKAEEVANKQKEEANKQKKEEEAKAAAEKERKEKEALAKDQAALEKFMTRDNFTSTKVNEMKVTKKIPSRKYKYPLHQAVKDKDDEIVRILLANEADVTKKNGSGKTALDKAMQYNVGKSHEKIISQLKARVAQGAAA